MCVCTPHVYNTHRGQKRKSDPLEVELVINSCEPPYGFWKLSPSPPEEPLVRVAIKPSLWPLVQMLYWMYYLQNRNRSSRSGDRETNSQIPTLMPTNQDHLAALSLVSGLQNQDDNL